MKIFKILLVLLTIVAINVQAKVPVYDASTFIKENRKANMVQSDFNRYDFEVIKSDAEKIFNQGDRQIKITNFPLRPDYHVTLNLIKQKTVFPKDAVIKRYGKDGEMKIMPVPNNPKYYGTIEGNQNSDVFFTYSSVGLVGYVQDDMGQIYDVSSKLDELNKKVMPHSVSETTIGQYMNEKHINMCASEDIANFDPTDINFKREKDANSTQKSDLIEIKLAVDANFEYYLKFCQFITGGNKNQWLEGEGWYLEMTEAELNQAYTNAVDYIENVVAASDRIYTREVGIILKLSHLTVFDNPEFDPYYNLFGANLGDKLNEMDNIWNLRFDEATDRTLATLFSDVERQPSNSTTLGIANSGNSYTGSLCSKTSGYSALGMQGNVKFPRLSFSQDVQVATHEFGHNFGCPHTHFCGWPQLTGEAMIDSCVYGQQAGDADCIQFNQIRPRQDGTIMSYCHFNGGKIVFNFHPRMKKRIIKHANESLKKCASVPKYPVVRLISPLGDDKLLANKPTTIRFQAANVPSAKLLYSTNGGGDWNEIATVNTAEDTTYVWNVPNVSTDNALVRIESTTDNNVFDQSVLLFKISQIAINVSTPIADADLGYLSDQKIVWQKSNVGNVNVMFSLDGGENYSEILLDKDLSSTVFNFPNQATDNGILLIESVDDPSINTKVPFRLGKEKVTFVAPEEGDTLNIDFPDFTIRFETEFINDKFNIKFKRNDLPEVNITSFPKSVDLETNTYEWTFSEDINPGDSGTLIAEIFTGEIEPIGNTQGKFYFDALTNVGRQYYDGYKIGNISPNPANNNIKLEIYNVQERLVRTNIYIITEDGKVCKTIENKYVVKGTSVENIDISDLQSGTYFVMIESDDYKDVQQLKIVR